MPTFLTVKEAAQITGKSSSSIRRVIYPILKDDHHPDREHIQPGIKEARALRLKGENFAWRISEELLQRAIPSEPAPEKGTEKHSGREAPDPNAELLAMLRRELEIKNQQITQQTEMLSRQMELISGLSERLREGNILIGSLQKQLAAPQPAATDAKSPVVETPPQSAKPKPSQAPAKASPKPAPKATPKPPVKPAKPPKPKRGFWRLFR